ncbi:MAG: hypothetical protein KKD97_05705 [Gammaproteobacteria bacterium]|nr:hypothetical protein [Gammaproteobacteria bacterium]
MKSTLIAGVVLCLLAGCSGEKQDPQPQANAVAETAPVPVVRAHNYDFQEGHEYGYTMAPTEDNARAGLAANQVTMIKYAGQKDGRYQLHVSQGSVLTAIECSYPCEVAKIMIIMDMPGVPPSTMNIQRVRLNSDAVAMLALDDAVKGKLTQYGRDKGGRKHSVWLDQQRGVVLTPVNDG